MAQKDYSNLIIPIAAGVVILTLGKKLSGAFNFFGDSEEDKANTAVITSAAGYFSPNYWKTKSGANITTAAYADAWCTMVYGAKGLFNDDEAKVYGAFAALKYKTQVSWLAQNFFAKYQKDLLGYLQGFLNTDEMAKVSSIVIKLI